MPVRRSLITCLALLGGPLALYGAPAQAADAEIAVVGVHVEGMNESEARAAAQTMVEAIAASSGVIPIPPEEVRSRLAGRERLVVETAFLGAGRRALDEGRILYERAEFEDAINALGSAVELLTEAMPAATDNRLLIDALLTLGLTHFSAGETSPASDAFRQVVVLDPTRRLDAVKYSKPTVEFFDKVRAEVEARGTGTIEVTGNPGLNVYIDGRSRGVTPLSLDGLPVGSHSVLVLGPDGQRAYEEVEVGKDARVKVSPRLDRGLLAETGASEDERRRQARQLYEALGTYVETDLVLMAGQISAGKVGIQLYEPRTGNLSTILSAEGGDSVDQLAATVARLPELVDDSGGLKTDQVFARAAPLDIGTNTLLLSLLLDPEPVLAQTVETGGETGAATEDKKRGPPWYVWAGIGTVAAGGATTAVLLSTGGASGGANGTITVGPLP